MSISVRWAIPTDRRSAVVNEHVSDMVLAARIADRRLAIAEGNSQTLGVLHLEYLWGTKPYIALIRVLPSSQRVGVGRALLAFVGSVLRKEGQTQLYSSSQTNESVPQAWHRHMGFVECGFIARINPGGVGEVFFVKEL
jgi:N-acetylglutamate synthase-like GNAT family acetyltransferase